ncbi:MAG: hypothetical protein JW776_09100 [Candidatus Lokiarchaeota archaeon]|nr:hypothetical protein [Candidatus Lokiarchaeota archaeon]
MPRFGRKIIRGPRFLRGPSIIRPFVRSYPRRIFRLTRRILFGSWIYLMIAGSSRPYKLYPQEVEEIEKQSGKSAEDMTEDELRASMNKLNIENREISDEEYHRINEINGKPTSNVKTALYCSYCGSELADPNGKYCSNCGSKVN